jgi:signal transduction histidine kinase
MRKEYLAIAVAGAIVVLLITLLTFLVSRSIAKPLTSLRQYALDLSEGRSSPFPQLPFDELKSLAKAIISHFNYFDYFRTERDSFKGLHSNYP